MRVIQILAAPPAVQPTSHRSQNEDLVDRDETKTLFTRVLCRLTALYAALATVCTTFATLLADKAAAQRGQTTLKTAITAALTRWRLLLVLHRGLWRIVALLLRRATVRRLRVLRLRGIALGRRPLVVVLRGGHSCVGSEEVSNVQIIVYERAQLGTLSTRWTAMRLERPEIRM